MSGILFPDLASAWNAAESSSASKAQRDWINEERTAKREIAPLIPKALAGDKDALDQIGTRHPDTLRSLLPMLDRADANKRAKAKEDVDYVIRTGVGLLNAPPESQAGLYAQARAQRAAQGGEVSNWPAQYDPAWVKFQVNQGMTVKDHLDRQNEGPQLVTPGGGAAPMPAGPGGSVIDRASAASKSLESGGRYDAVGPVVNDKGNRAYGAHQVMDFNIGPWTQEVLGQAMTPQQFLASPQAQDAVYKVKMGQYIQKYGSPEAGARAWFAGEGGMNNPNAKDVLGTSVQSYGQRFAQAYGPGAMGPQPAMGTPPQSLVAAGSNAAPMPQPPGGMAVPGTPAQMPSGPPGLAQGSDMPRGDGSGNPIQTSDGGMVPREAMRMITPVLPPGTFLGKDPKTGKFMVQEGNFVVYDGNKNPVGLIPVPKAKEPGAAPAGYRFSPDGRTLQVIPGGPADKPQGTGPFTGKSPEAEGLNMLVATGVLTARQAAELAAGKTVTDPETKQMIFMTPSGIFGQTPGQAPQPLAGPPAGVPAPAAPTATPANSGAIPLTGTKATGQPTAKEIQDIRTARAEAETIIKTLEDFRNESKNATMPDRLMSLGGATTGLNTSYNVAALLAKGEALFNLGVLNGPDLDIIRRTLPDPSTLRGGAASNKAVDAAVDKVINVIKTKVEAREKQLGIGQQGASPAAPPANKGTYIGPNNTPVSWPEIEDTAKKRGISTDEVIGRLGLKPTGMQ